MDTRWICTKCSSWNTGTVSRCSFCSEPRPAPVGEAAETPTDVKLDGMTQRLHNIVEKLTPLQKQKLFRWFEDNVL